MVLAICGIRTEEIHDVAAIGEASRGLVKVRFAVGWEIRECCCVGDKTVGAHIREGVSENEISGHVNPLLQPCFGSEARHYNRHT